MKKRIGVLLSGRGSNFVALAESVATGRIPNAEIAIVVSDLGWNQQQRIVLVLCLGFGIAGITGVTGAIIINNLHGINMLTQFNSVPGHHHFRH